MVPKANTCAESNPTPGYNRDVLIIASIFHEGDRIYPSPTKLEWQLRPVESSRYCCLILRNGRGRVTLS